MAGHWSIPTQYEAANGGGTFFVVACGSMSGARNESMKDVTCKKCKALYALPTRPDVAVAKLMHDVVKVQDAESETFQFVEVGCNACDTDLDVSTWRGASFGAIYVEVQKATQFLAHCAYDHIGGAEVNFKIVASIFSAYQLNLAVGKPAMTGMEESWRERMEVVDAPA